MKTTLITAALLVSTALVTAQEKKQATVRIKKIENINGVEKITDTTYTTDDASAIKIDNGTVNIEEISAGKDGEMKKIVIVNGKEGEGKMTESEIDALIEKAMKEAGGDENKKGAKKVIVINEDGKPCDKNEKGKHVSKMVMVKIDMTDASAEDLKLINKQTGATDGKLALNNMNFYPNPSNGKFNLSFSLPEKGGAEITILNIEGKKVYSENLPNFIGAYDKEIDISKNPKGVYFVRIEQGKHAQVKKVVLE